jgi:hypothetical protein
MADKLLCGHCGNELTVPQAIAHGGKEALACFSAECERDCQSAEALASSLDDQTFWRWSKMYCDRREALLAGDEFEEAEPDGGTGQEDNDSGRLYAQTAWTHHFPQWVQSRIREIMDRSYNEMINELKSGGGASSAAEPLMPAPRLFQLSPAAEKTLRLVAGVFAAAVVIKALQVYSII